MKTKEKDLIEPALKILSRDENLINGISTTELALELRKLITPTTEDLLPLKGRKDDRLSQVIRNLISHRSLIKTGFVEYTPSIIGKSGNLRLSSRGRIYRQTDPNIFLYTYKRGK